MYFVWFQSFSFYSDSFYGLMHGLVWGMLPGTWEECVIRPLCDSAVAWFGWWVEHLVAVCVVWLLFHAAQVCFPVNLLLWKVGRWSLHPRSIACFSLQFLRSWLHASVSLLIRFLRVHVCYVFFIDWPSHCCTLSWARVDSCGTLIVLGDQN